MESKPILYLSFDIESDGPTPMINNLLSIGMVGIDFISEQIIFEFEENIKPFFTHIPDKDCMKNFWLKPEQKNAWEFLQTNQKNYIVVFEELSFELKRLSRDYKLVFVSHPSCFDWMFLKCYYELAKSNSSNGEDFYDIGYKCECSLTLCNHYKKINGLTNNEFMSIFQKPDEVISENNLEHFALYDAKIQGKKYIELLKKMYS